jgi:diguanylate cyclase (GGDEF)-like protein
MAQPHRSNERTLWTEFQSVFSEFAGCSVQAFDENGNPFRPSPALPSLCTFFQRFSETSAACRKDCFRKAASCGASRRILSARCYGGLSYRIVPIRKRNRPYAVILVGRVLTEVVGAEQCLALIERYKVSRQSFLESLAGVRTLGKPELDKAAVVIRRLASTALAMDTRLENRATLLRRRRALMEFARQAVFADARPGRERTLLEALGQMLSASGAALLLPGEDGCSAEVRASVGLGEDVLHVLAHHDWRRTLRTLGDGTRMLLPTRQQMLAAGLDCPGSTLAARSLTSNRSTVGHLVVAGPGLRSADGDLLDAASDFVTARVVHEKLRARAEQKEQEARLFDQVAERFLTARSVPELLGLALDAAMHGLRARRGSILLAEEQGRIVGRALRGPHAPLSETIDVLRPDSVSHKVFFSRQSLLVRDSERELAPGRQRQFPYATRSFVSVPLRDDGRALGVLHLTEREGEEEFTPRDLSLLERLSRQAADAICRTRLEEEVRWLRVASATDHLTGAYNRRFFELRLNEEIQRADRFGQPLSVAMLDVDGFKELNDQFGHDCGDQTLKGIADTIRGQLRSVDILARYGGDEFVVLLPGTGAEGALRTAERIRSRVAAADLPGPVPAASRRCTVSVGVCVYPDHAAAADGLLHGADQSLLEAKRAGRNTILLRQS